MTIDDLQSICKKLPGVTEDIKWENHLCFCVGGKMFLITGLEETPVNASFKTTEEHFEELCQRKGFKPAPYLAKNKWVYVEDINLMSKKDWQIYTTEAYQLIFQKLPRKIQAQFAK